jgi:cytochrome c peroxidase
MPATFNPDGLKWVDQGLGGELKKTSFAADAEKNLGKHKVPTLRNVDKRPSEHYVKCYGHNGYFKSLESIVQFYNTRDIPGMWSSPEVAQNVNKAELGNLGLGSDEVASLVAFLRTLSDGYVPSGSSACH